MSISAATDVVVSTARYYYLRNLKQGYSGCVDAKPQGHVVFRPRDTVRRRSSTLLSSLLSMTDASPVCPLPFSCLARTRFLFVIFRRRCHSRDYIRTHYPLSHPYRIFNRVPGSCSACLTISFGLEYTLTLLNVSPLPS